MHRRRGAGHRRIRQPPLQGPAHGHRRDHLKGQDRVLRPCRRRLPRLLRLRLRAHYDHVRFQFRPGRRAEAGLAVHRQPSSGSRLVPRWHRGGEVLDLPERVAPGPPWSTRPMRRSSHCTAHRPVSTAVPSPLTHVFRDVGRILTACSRQDAQGLRLQRHDATRCGWRRRGLAGMRWRACRLADAGYGRSGGSPRHRSTRAEE